MRRPRSGRCIPQGAAPARESLFERSLPIADRRLAPRVATVETFWMPDATAAGATDEALAAVAERFGAEMPQGFVPLLKARMPTMGVIESVTRWIHENRTWPRSKCRHRPEWIDELHCREIPKAWLNDFVDSALQRYRSVYIIQPYLEQENR